MRTAVCLSLLFALASCRTLVKRNTRDIKGGATPFIVGGQESAKGKWPWQLSLQVADSDWEGNEFFRHTCGAVLLNEDWVLCAAHCVMFGVDVNDYELLAGAFDSTVANRDPEQVLKIAEWYDHPDFSPLNPGLPGDIAIFKLANKADLSNPNIAGISMASGGDDFSGSSECWITGWGRLGGEESGSSPKLQELNIPVFTNTECDRRWAQSIIGIVHPILDVHICVGNDDGSQSACQGDSGGPLSCKENGEWVVAGITSRGWPDCEIFPSIYTRVSSYKEWADNTIANN